MMAHHRKKEQIEPFVDSQAVFMEEALQNSKKVSEPKRTGLIGKLKDLLKR